MADPVVSNLVDHIRTDARGKLLDLLDEVAGKKVLVLDSTVVGPLDLIVKASDLKDHGVQNFVNLTDQPYTGDGTQMIFLVRAARVELVDWIAAQILSDESQNKDRTYVVMFVPRQTEQCLERLGRGNVRANVRIAEYDLHFFPFDKDILSMQAPGLFHDFHVQGDPSSPFYAAKALMSLQHEFGVIPQVHSIGGAGKCVVDIMQRLRKEEDTSEAQKNPRTSREVSQPGIPPVAPHATQKERAGSSQAPKINELILIDRRVDLFSVLCSQFTYQALIDVVFGVNNNAADLSSTDWAKGQDPKVRFAPDDPFTQEIRDLHIDKLGPLLQQRAMDIQTTYKEKDNVKDPKEMAEYIKKFKTAQSAHPLLELHINLASHLKGVIQSEDYGGRLKLEDDITAGSAQNALDSIEDYIDDQKPFHEVLRLICLYSLVNNGVKAKQLDQLKRCIVQSYGFEHLLTLCNAERVGILRYQQGKSVWSQIKQKFNLFVEDVSTEKDISYAYSGYAPLSIRLVQMAKSMPKGWLAHKEALSLLYGPAQELQQTSDLSDGPSVVLVCFLGGVTYGEIAALRKLSELEEGRRKFLIVTTEFINAKKLFHSMRCEQVFNQQPLESRRAKPQEQKRGFGFWPGGR